MRKIQTFLIIIIFACLITSNTVVYGGTQTPSGITALTLIERVRRDLSETDANKSGWTNADFIQWSDEAIRIINSITKGLETSEGVRLDAGVSSYALSTSHYDINHVIYDSGVSGDPQRFNVLQRVEPSIMAAVEIQEPRPKYWWEWGGRIYIWPTPDVDISGTRMDVFMVSKPVGVTTTASSIETPFYFDPFIVFYMRAKALMKYDRIEEGGVYLKLFFDMIERFRQDVIRREQWTVTMPQKEE